MRRSIVLSLALSAGVLWPNSQILDSREGYFTRAISEADFALGLCVCFQHINFFFHEKAPANAKTDTCK